MFEIETREEQLLKIHVNFFSSVVQAEEAQRKIKRQNGEDSGTTIYT